VSDAAAAARPTPTPAGAAEIAAGLTQAAADFQVDLLRLAAIASVESGFRPLAKNPNSSAFGLFQFITGTWNDVVGRHGAAVGVSAADRAVLRAQCLMGAAHLADNAAALARVLGRAPDQGECYAAHFFGLGDARRLLRMPRGTPADAALGTRAAAVIGANRPIFVRNGVMRSVGEVLQLFDAKMARGVVAARALPI
jgi:soluble lytic murein transglycosylase-like protein